MQTQLTVCENSKATGEDSTRTSYLVVCIWLCICKKKSCHIIMPFMKINSRDHLVESRQCQNCVIVKQLNTYAVVVQPEPEFQNQNYINTATSVKALYHFALTLRSSGPLPKCFTLWFLCSLFDRLLNWLECLTAPRGDVIWRRTTHCPYTRSVFCLQSALLYSTLGKELDILCLCKQCSESNECPVWETFFQYHVSQFPCAVECTGCDYC